MTTTSIIVPPGKYVLSDPCYCVHYNLWDDTCKSSDYFDNPEASVSKDGTTYKIFAFHTEYGDGGYTGSDGFEYSVDSGLIGLTPLALCENQTYDDSLGTLVTFTEATECTECDGVLTFGDIIDTSGRDDSDSYEEDDWYDSDDNNYDDEDFGGD